AEHADDINVAILDEAAGKIGHRIDITARSIHNAEHADAVLARDLVVVLAVRRRDVNNPRTAGRTDEVAWNDDMPLCNRHIAERRFVRLADELAPRQRADDFVILFHDALDER